MHTRLCGNQQWTAPPRPASFQIRVKQSENEPDLTTVLRVLVWYQVRHTVVPDMRTLHLGSNLLPESRNQCAVQHAWYLHKGTSYLVPGTSTVYQVLVYCTSTNRVARACLYKKRCIQVSTFSKGSSPNNSWFNFDMGVCGTTSRPTWQSKFPRFFIQVCKSRFFAALFFAAPLVFCGGT